jgi:high-affinity Fe2+/Pb2+ permease
MVSEKGNNISTSLAKWNTSFILPICNYMSVRHKVYEHYIKCTSTREVGFFFSFIVLVLSYYFMIRQRQQTITNPVFSIAEWANILKMQCWKMYLFKCYC